MRVLIATLMWVGVTFAVSSSADEVSKEVIAKGRAELEGKWNIQQLVVNGEPAKEELNGPLTWVNKADGTWSLMSGRNVMSKGTSTIDPSANPKTIKFTSVGDDGETNVMLGIYELSKKQLKICFAAAGATRPTKMASDEGSEHTFVILKNVPVKPAFAPVTQE